MGIGLRDYLRIPNHDAGAPEPYQCHRHRNAMIVLRVDLDFRIGRRGRRRWVHIGTDSNYIALTEAHGAKVMPELRHIGVEVDDVEALMDRLAAAGFEAADASALDSHPFRRRVYYVDGNGLDWEFIEYLSENPAERNDYSH